MNILLAGRLGRYAERVLALRDRGHRLVYCTLPPPRQSPLPDDLKDDSIPRHVLVPGQAADRVRQLIDEYEIDVVYSMKNVWDGSLELVDELVRAGVGPVVRHYKEHFCVPSPAEERTLVGTAGQIYINEESLAYFGEEYQVDPSTAHVLDTDYLPAAYLSDELRPKLSAADGRPHLLVAGGVSVNRGRHDVRALCEVMIRRRVHVHIYGAKYIGPDSTGVWATGHEGARREYDRLSRSGFVHLHGHVDPPGFCREWSVYDAGLLHVDADATHDSPFQHLNRPNRIAPYLAAGLPLAQQAGRQRAMEREIREAEIGMCYRTFDELADQLEDRELLARLGNRVREARWNYTYERHADALLAVLARYAHRPAAL